MGYSPLYFPFHVQAWLDAGWLKPGYALMDFGAQEFDSGPCDGAFLRKHGLPDSATVGEVYDALGVKYHSIDVDGAHGSTFFDLNSFAPPAEWRNAFDFVNNEGTTEHLVNPINGFQVAHEIAKVGSVIRHSVPLSGGEHGFTYPTAKFYAHLVGDNGYEVLKALALVSSREIFRDPLFRSVINATDGRPEEPEITCLWGELTYRKTNDRPFVIPVDHLTGPNAEEARRRLIENHNRFAIGRQSDSAPSGQGATGIPAPLMKSSCVS